MLRRVSRKEIRRALWAVSAVAAAEIVGTVGFHVIEGAGWVNAFYFESMLATGQGPPFTLYTNAGKIFASVMGFVSVGSVLSVVLFVVGPIALRLWHEGVHEAEAAARRIETAALADLRRAERDLTGQPPPNERPPTGPPP